MSSTCGVVTDFGFSSTLNLTNDLKPSVSFWFSVLDSENHEHDFTLKFNADLESLDLEIAAFSNDLRDLIECENFVVSDYDQNLFAARLANNLFLKINRIASDFVAGNLKHLEEDYLPIGLLNRKFETPIVTLQGVHYESYSDYNNRVLGTTWMTYPLIVIANKICRAVNLIEYPEIVDYEIKVEVTLVVRGPKKWGSDYYSHEELANKVISVDDTFEGNGIEMSSYEINISQATEV